jgi:hypothetical protein
VFAFWGVLVGGVLVVGWIARGQEIGIWLAALVAALYWILAAQAREQQRSLVRLVSLAAENERQPSIPGRWGASVALALCQPGQWR